MILYAERGKAVIPPYAFVRQANRKACCWGGSGKNPEKANAVL